MIDFDTLQKLPNNVGNLDKLIVAKGFKMLPKVQKSPKLVTLPIYTLTVPVSETKVRALDS